MFLITPIVHSINAKRERSRKIKTSIYQITKKKCKNVIMVLLKILLVITRVRRPGFSIIITWCSLFLQVILKVEYYILGSIRAMSHVMLVIIFTNFVEYKVYKICYEIFKFMIFRYVNCISPSDIRLCHVLEWIVK